MSAQRAPVRELKFRPLYRAVRQTMWGCVDLAWPYWIGAHMITLVRAPQKDDQGRMVMVTRAV